MHHKFEFYEFDEFCWHFELRARFDNQENHIWGEFGDIEDPKKTGIHPNYDFRPKATNLKFKIKNKKFTEFTLGINDDFMMS